ncbi:aminopeptidase [Seinonella peptonophila]|uniref:Aminopeptidase n=1 Tax=Seinonella peptonophila TaxID=112248 RepID=A0A1M4VMN6_9BACL|nr:aminopeptidase [Seinonella peptonophila]SHE70070.1 aminopeptidase [Seinonella peptonophila]
MRDSRVIELAKLLVHHSCRVQPGENVLIDLFGEGRELVLALIEEIYRVGGYPHVQLHDQLVHRQLLLGTSEPHVHLWTDYSVYKMKQMDCYIGVRGSNSDAELQDVPDEKLKQYMRTFSHQVHSEQRVKNTKWVVLRYPSSSFAQMADMSTPAFEDFYFRVCNLDYERMSLAMDALVKRMEQADKVHIVGPGTDLQFSIKGIPVVKCAGEFNIPDGEVFTAPVKDSINGVITINTPSPYAGTVFEQVRFELVDGKITTASANKTERINQILDTDEGARYIGEFSLGINPYIDHPMKDILFDEKIHGSFHFTPGQAYEEADNGNRSAIHWDLVSIQRSDYGGGEIYFDGECIRRDGLFVVPDLEPLNPENLK